MLPPGVAVERIPFVNNGAFYKLRNRDTQSVQAKTVCVSLALLVRMHVTKFYRNRLYHNKGKDKPARKLYRS